MNWLEEYLQARQSRLQGESKRDVENGAAPAHSLAGWDDLSLLDEIGGPIPLSKLGEIGEMDFSRACQKYDERSVIEVAMPYGCSVEVARRHWPWISKALWRYNYHQTQDCSNVDPSPRELRTLFDQIRSDSQRLEKNLNQLEEACKAVRDRSEIAKELHLNFLEELLVQAVSGTPSPNLDQNVSVRMRNFDQYREWRFALYNLIVGVRHCQDSFDRDLVAATERVTLPGLRDLVTDIAVIWQSFTNRPPSVEKVHSRHGDVPDFVVFIQKLVELEPGATVPSFYQVQNAMKPRNKREIQPL